MLSLEELLTEEEGEDVVDPASDSSDMQLSDRPRAVVQIGCSGTGAPLVVVVGVVVAAVDLANVYVLIEEALAAVAALTAATSRADRLMACA
jgi:hypothetical protein